MTSKAITLKQVAQHAGVSYQTVSKVLNKQGQVSKETESRILEAVRVLGYRPNLMARNMRQGRTRMIGYSWMPTSDDQFNPILDRFLQSMAQEAEYSHYHVILFPHRSGQELLDLYDELIGTRQVDAFVISNVEFNDERILHLQKRKFPFIAFGRSSQEMDFPFVDVDGGKGMYDLVCHLSGKGHERIAVLAWPEDSRVGQNRMDGLLAGLADCGIELLPDLLLRGQGSAQFGRQAASSLLDLPRWQRPTAIIGLNDFMAIGAMQLAQERGLRVGEDIAIAGFDDNPISQYLIPALTSVRQPIMEVGKTIISVLISLLEKEDPSRIPVNERQILLSPELVVRAST